MLRDKVIKYLEDRFMDISPDTVRSYKEKFRTMSDKQLIEYFKNGGKFRLYVKDDEIDSKKLDKLIEKMNITTQERIRMPYKGNAISKSEVIIFPVQIRRLQQLATKESASKIDTSRRNKAGQASGASKTGKISDTEVNQLASLGLDRTLTELMSPRSDNIAGKTSMNDQIREDMKFSLSKTPDSKHDKTTLSYIDAIYKCMNIATDLVDYIDDISY